MNLSKVENKCNKKILLFFRKLNNFVQNDLDWFFYVTKWKKILLRFRCPILITKIKFQEKNVTIVQHNVSAFQVHEHFSRILPSNDR